MYFSLSAQRRSSERQSSMKVQAARRGGLDQIPQESFILSGRKCHFRLTFPRKLRKSKRHVKNEKTWSI